MTENEERLEELKDAICEMVCIAEDAVSRKWFELLDSAGAEVIDCLDELYGYRAIGTIEEFKALKEKNVAKKVEYFSETFQSYTCPSCETPINNGGMAKGVYCKWCGQKFDWSE